jgi:ribosomal-protein-alanine N-acetyltransferase
LLFETDRFFVSNLLHKDLEEARILHNHIETLRWLSDTSVVSPEQQLNWFKSLEKSETSKRWVVREKKNNYLVSVIRIDQIDKINNSLLIGLDVHNDYRRVGIATEIYKKLIPYLFHNYKLNRLSLVTISTNLAAVALYKSLGFLQEGILRKAFYRDNTYVDGVIFALIKEDIEIN